MNHSNVTPSRRRSRFGAQLLFLVLACHGCGGEPTAASTVPNDAAKLDAWIAEDRILALKLFLSKNPESEHAPRAEQALQRIVERTLLDLHATATEAGADPRLADALTRVLRHAIEHTYGSLRYAVHCRTPQTLEHDHDPRQVLTWFKHGLAPNPGPEAEVRSRIARAWNRPTPYTTFSFRRAGKHQDEAGIEVTYELREVGPFDSNWGRYSRLAADWTVEVYAPGVSAVVEGTCEIPTDFGFEYKVAVKDKSKPPSYLFYAESHARLAAAVTGGVMRALGLRN